MTPIISTAHLIAELDRLHVLPANQLDELRSRAVADHESKALARELLERGWLTAYQANLLLQDRGDLLLLGSYILLDRLGEGGMGTVFRARNWKLGRVCAVKLIRKERLNSADAVRRFYREIRAAAQLDHVNVVRAYDADEVNGTHYFAMEFVDGIDLVRLVRKHGPSSPALACAYIRQAALGLQHAHERGLVHRDIKPANLLLTRAPGAGIIKILDMGLARQDEAVAGEVSGTLTQVGMVMGTPDYMAPEQSISSHTVDGRADLYSLGCSLYFLLTASVPFPGGSPLEKLLKHQMEQPKLLEILRPDVPAALADIVYKLMAKKPTDRFPTAAALAAELETLLNEPRIWQAVPAATGKRATVPVNDGGDSPTDPFWAGIVTEVKEEAVEQPPGAGAGRWVVGAGIALIAILTVWLIASLFRESPANNAPTDGNRKSDQKGWIPRREKADLAPARPERPADREDKRPAPKVEVTAWQPARVPVSLPR